MQATRRVRSFESNEIYVCLNTAFRVDPCIHPVTLEEARESLTQDRTALIGGTSVSSIDEVEGLAGWAVDALAYNLWERNVHAVRLGDRHLPQPSLCTLTMQAPRVHRFASRRRPSSTSPRRTLQRRSR